MSRFAAAEILKYWNNIVFLQQANFSAVSSVSHFVFLPTIETVQSVNFSVYHCHNFSIFHCRFAFLVLKFEDM